MKLGTREHKLCLIFSGSKGNFVGKREHEAPPAPPPWEALDIFKRV